MSGHRLRELIRSKSRRKELLRWIEGLDSAGTSRYSAEIAYIRSSGYAIFPYEWARELQRTRVAVFKDRDGLPYVLRNGRRLFFPENWGEARIEEYYRWLLCEQCPQSPHRYSNLSESMGQHRTFLVDVGSAEGIWAFDNADIASGIVLCEPKDEWGPSLERTFSQLEAPHRIVRASVGSTTGEGAFSVDTLLEGHDCDQVALKVDVEGSELEVLEGATATFRRSSRTSWDICLYHNAEDENRILSQIRHSCGYIRSIDINPGYMVYPDEARARPPLLRRGVARIIHEASG